MFIPQAFSFENIDRDGKGLCLGETVIFEEEINPFMSKLREHNIISLPYTTILLTNHVLCICISNPLIVHLLLPEKFERQWKSWFHGMSL